MYRKIFGTVNDNRSLIPRLIVGLVFLSEGLQKFILPEVTGAGRFEKIGFENPAFLAAFVATFEVISGALILAGAATRLAAIPILTIMITAIVTTKIPVLIDEGFWSMAHAARTDFAMMLLSIYLLIYGAGKWSLDRWMFNFR
ncbi:MAG: DoxX family protein [Marinilabilia sp.]